MIVYVETNFLLELAYLQERCDSCQEILELAKAGAITLLLPAFSAAEARATLHRRASERREFQESLQKHIREISRSETFRGLDQQSRDILAAFVSGGEETRERLESAVQAINELPLTRDVVVKARRMNLICRHKMPSFLHRSRRMLPHKRVRNASSVRMRARSGILLRWPC